MQSAGRGWLMADLDLQEARHLPGMLRDRAKELGFADLAITGPLVRGQEARLDAWLANGYQGEMHWMASPGISRHKTEHLLPGTRSLLIVRMNYRRADDRPRKLLQKPQQAYVARYALGRDYHKILRKRLLRLAEAVAAVAAPLLEEEGQDPGLLRFRPIVDSAPLLEKPLAAQAGLGWTGKNTLLLTDDGSWFLLGLLLTNLRLAKTDTEITDKCGACRACLSICPTQAFPAPYVLDARRCISYLTIENPGTIPREFRPAMGNRVFGCDDCQLVCPWNRFAQFTSEADFKPRQQLDTAGLLELFLWTREEFELRTRGSAVRRAGYTGWRRNLAVALGNAPPDLRVTEALRAARAKACPLLLEHIDWALEEQSKPAARAGAFFAAAEKEPPRQTAAGE